MSIPEHQIRNILKSYARLLSRKEKSFRSQEVEAGRGPQASRFRAEAKRRMVITKVVDEIIQKIIDNYGSLPGVCSKTADRKDQDLRRKNCFHSNETVLIFYKVEQDGKKRKFRIRRRQ